MSFRFRLAFAVIAVVQILALLGLVAEREYTLRQGTEVVLQTIPVDPRSLFQGDYAILRYEISRPPSYQEFEPGETVYVTLEAYFGMTEDEPLFWRTGVYSTDQPPERGKVFIRGRMGGDGEIDFGIGTYFVHEGTGGVIEDAGDVKVVVAVDGRGKAVIKYVLVDGVPFDEARRESR